MNVGTLRFRFGSLNPNQTDTGMVQAISYGCHLHRPDNFLLTVASLGGSLLIFELCQMGCCTFKSAPANAGQNGTGTQTDKNPQSGTDTRYPAISRSSVPVKSRTCRVRNLPSAAEGFPSELVFGLIVKVGQSLSMCVYASFSNSKRGVDRIGRRLRYYHCVYGAEQGRCSF